MKQAISKRGTSKSSHLAPSSWLLPTVLCAVAALSALLWALPASAADLRGGWGNWWLPPNRSTHGDDIDWLFNVIFWITMVTFIGVEIVLVYFLIKYRGRPGRKAIFTHGNTRLEMFWTVAPAFILAFLALASKKVWDNVRYSPLSQDPGRARLLVIGQQFKWNVIYAGADGKLGRYMLFPKPTDLAWPPNADGSPYTHAGVRGPAFLPYDQAVNAINTYIDQVNPLGKDFTDPDGLDDNWDRTPGREMVLPAKRAIEVQLSSKDVIHDFFLPNFRVKLDAVPGMRGVIHFQTNITSRQREEASRRRYPVDELVRIFEQDPRAEFSVAISEKEQTEGAEDYKPPRGPRFWRYKDKDNRTIIRDGMQLGAESVAKLKEAGIKEVFAYEPGHWELVCEELCGSGHNTMTNRVVVVDDAEFRERFEKQPGPSVASTDE